MQYVLVALQYEEASNYSVLIKCNFYNFTLWMPGVMGVRREGQGAWLPWILKLLARKGCFSISRGKKQISPLLAPTGKNFGKIRYCRPPWKKSFRRPCPGPSTRSPYPLHATGFFHNIGFHYER